jgi:Delta3-Delta2-enoyl-CoA isomerase
LDFCLAQWSLAGNAMATVTLEKQGNVFVLRMSAGENRFSFPFFDELEAALDEVMKSSGAAALVTVGEGKFYSNGIDLEWLSKQTFDPSEFIGRMHRVYAKVLAFPMITVAALNGHAFAGGAMLALAHDFRVMRTDRGYFCLPEVDISIPFTVPMSALIRHRLHPVVAHEAMVTGRRFTAAEALAARIVDDTATEEAVLSRAVSLAEPLAGKERGTLGAIKRNSAATVLSLLEA